MSGSRQSFLEINALVETMAKEFGVPPEEIARAVEANAVQVEMKTDLLGGHYLAVTYHGRMVRVDAGDLAKATKAVR